jgi:predicted enzyme related to lactoylglutathione lyase
MGNPVTQWQIVTKNPEQHAAFYAAVFGWTIRSDNPLGYRAADTGPGRGIPGGFWPAPPEASAFVQLFAEVGNMAETIAKAVKSGGSVLIPPQTLPAGDQMAILRDPMGVTFGVVTPAKAV